LEQLEEAERTAAGEFVAPKGELVVSAPLAFGRLHVLPVIADFLAKFPDISVRLLLADRNVDLVEEHVDMAVRLGDLPDSDMVATRIGSMRTVVCASPDLLGAHGRPQAPADLVRFPCIVFDGPAPSPGWRFGPGLAAVPVKSRLTVSTADAARQAAIQGVGVTRLLYYQVADAVEDGRLTIILEPFEPKPAPVHLLHVARGQMPLKMRRFLDFAAPQLRQALAHRVVIPEGAVEHMKTVAHRLTQVTERSAYFSATQDVTTSKLVEEALNAEAELRRTNLYLTEAQRLSRTGSFTWDVAAEDSIWSEEMYRIFDVPPAPKSGLNTVQRAVHPDDAPILDDLRRRIRHARDFDVEFRIVTASGLKHLHIVAHRIDDSPGRPIFVGAVQDITQSKLVEATLEAREAELRRANLYLTEAQRLSRTGSFTWDVAAEESVWSEETYRIFELPSEPFTTESGMVLVRRAIHPEDAPILDDLHRRIWEVRDFDFEFRIVTASGLKHLHTVAHRIDNTPDRPIFVGAVQDVTESKRTLRSSSHEALDARLVRRSAQKTRASSRRLSD
jgi:DNA-binding transcriptional LysR family regulator